jgi:AraC-like DNA-binding protein/mannose-6-phosphate isomerase-like protein (cupin superfamily)
MQTWYAYAGRDAAELRRGLAVMVHNEFTDGDLEIASRSRDVRAFIRTGLNRPITFMHSLNGTDISFRRSWHHIRARKAAVRLLYFVLQGEMQVVTAAGTHSVTPGRCAIINANEPFYTRTLAPEGGSFESALAVVPEHLVLSRMPWARQLTTCFEIDPAHRQVVTSLLELLCFEGDRLSRRAADPLADAFLESVSDGVGLAGGTPVTSLADRRFMDIRECIQKHVTCADLTCERVAEYCGISPRYLCHVLRANDTSFSELLWSQRLPKARDWLVSDTFRQYPIHKIACMAGFKSAAHFSRMFKSAYGVSPKEYRADPGKASSLLA